MLTIFFPMMVFCSFLVLAFLITRPLTVLFHELGHAIPAILLTKEKVTIYVGSYGDPNKSQKFNFGLLEVWFKYNPFSWRQGLCVPSAKVISVHRQIVYTLTGPMASFLFAVLACYFTFSFDLHGSIKLFLVVFLPSSIFDLVINLIPSKKSIVLYNGTIVYNDGYSLRRLSYYRRLPKEYLKAVAFFNEEDYNNAGAVFNQILTTNWKDENIYRLALISNLNTKNYEKAKQIVDCFIPLDKMNSDDYANAGIAYSHLGLHDNAMKFYGISLKQNPDNLNSLNNKGFTLNLLDRYKEAIPLFDKAIELDSRLAYSYSNRGFSKIKTGKETEGLSDINYSLQLDKNNSYAYRNLGIYQLDKGEKAEALKLFIKAKELDDTTHQINELLKEAEEL